EEKIVEGIAHLFPWEEIGFQVVGSFTHAAPALDYILNHPVDVVLSDIEMPGMNGLQLCEALQVKEGIHIVFFSSYQNYEYFRSAIRLSVDDYLLKPINYTELLTCFARVKSRLDEEHKQVEEHSGGYYEQIVARTVQYLKEHYRQASLEEAAELVNLSPAYLSKIFKEKNGAGFSDMLSSIRMNKAKEMLVPADLYEAAAIDGAKPIQQFFRITIPQITPIIFFNLINQTITALQNFTSAFVITNGGPMKSTYVLGMKLYKEGFSYFKMGYASAISWVMFVIIMIVTLILFRSSSMWVHYADE
ncbi:MAG: response regulator, partial [Lachnospiraceae bacterium]|nr:response regulator [Lachnospiraceae bacterium]